VGEKDTNNIFSRLRGKKFTGQRNLAKSREFSVGRGKSDWTELGPSKKETLHGKFGSIRSKGTGQLIAEKTILKEVIEVKCPGNLKL